MIQYFLRRLGLAVAVAVTVSVLSFLLLYLAVDPAIQLAGEDATPAEIDQIRQAYGLDRPVVVQYADWLWRAVQGDLGESHYFKRDVAELIAARMPTTALLGTCSILVAIAVAVPLGVVAAVRPNSWVDRLALFLAIFGQALPNFWFGLILIIFLSVKLHILPVSGFDSWQHLVMPTIVLGTAALPAIMRLTRAGMLDVLSADFIRTAYAKGASPKRVLFKHALRVAILPVVSLTAVQFGHLLSGAVVVESIFAINGVGSLALESISRSDIPTIQASVLLFSVIFIVMTLLADILNAWIDPRVRSA